jgi:hypothetical protein
VVHRRFPIRIGRRSRPLLRLFGVRDGNAYVDLEGDLDGDLDAQDLEGLAAELSALGIPGEDMRKRHLQ